VFNGTNFLSNGTNFHEKEYGDRSCCDQQSGKVFRSEQKLTELAFRHCCLLSHALLRFQYQHHHLGALDRLKGQPGPPPPGFPFWPLKI
jgi:hypothetical protein